MLVYLLTGLISFLSLRNYENVDTGIKRLDICLKKFYKYFTIIFLALIFGLRDYHVGTDTLNYLGIFNGLGKKFIWENMFCEKGFCVLSILVNKLFGNFTVFLIVCGLIIYFNIINVFCSLSESPSISILCYFSIGSFAQSCNILRQNLALSFCLVALYYLIKKDKPILFTLFVFIGFLFHKSAILFLVILPLRKFKINIKRICIISTIAILGIPLILIIIKIFDSYLGTTYYNYIIEYGKWSPLNIIILIGSYVCLFISELTKIKFNFQRKDTKIFEKYIVILFIFIILMLYSVTISELIDRIAVYFLPSIYLIIPIIFKSLKKYKSKILLSFMLVAVVVFLVYMLGVRGTYGVNPYNFVF